MEQVINFFSGVINNHRLGVVLLQSGLVLFAAYVLHCVLKIIFKKLQVRVEGTETIWDDVFLESINMPILVLLWLLTFTLIIDIMSHVINHSIMHFTPYIRKVGMAALFSWIFLRMIGSIEHFIARDSFNFITDKGTAYLITKVGKGVVLVIAAFLILEAFGFSLSGLIAVGGIGGIAVSLAAQNMLSNIFGAITLYMDKPFTVGEVIDISDLHIKGMVMEVGWRITKIKNGDRMVIYVPNSTFNKSSIINVSRIKNRHMVDRIGMSTGNISQYTAILDAIKDYLVNHKHVNQSLYIGVILDNFGDGFFETSIDCYLNTTDFNTFQTWRSEMLIDIYNLINEHNGKIMFTNDNKQLLRPDVGERMQEEE